MGWLFNLLQPCNLSIFNFFLSLSLSVCIFLYLFLTVQLIDVNGLLQPGRLSNQTAKRRLYRHIEAALATSSKTRQKLAATWRRLSFLWLHLDCLCLPAAWLLVEFAGACQPQTPPTPQNQSGMEKLRTFHTPIGDKPARRLALPLEPHCYAHIFNLLNDICLERRAQCIYPCVYVCIYLYLPRYICASGPKASIFNFISVARPQRAPLCLFHYLFFQFAFAGFVFWLQHSAFSGSWFAHLNFKWLLIFSRIFSFLFSVFFFLVFALLYFSFFFWLSCAYRWSILWHSKQTVSPAIGLPVGIYK